MLARSIPKAPIAVIALSIIMGKILASGLPTYYALAFILCLAIGLLYIAKPVWFLSLMLLFIPTGLPFLTSVRAGGGGADVGLAGVFASGLAILALLNVLVVPGAAERANHPLVRWFSLFCVVYTVAVLYSPALVPAVKTLNQFYSILGIMVLMMVFSGTLRHAMRLVRSAMWGAAIPVTLACLTFVATRDRVDGNLGHPNILAFFLVVIFGCVIFRLDVPGAVERISRQRWVCLAVITAALVFTQTRSGWLAFLVFLASFALLFNRRLIVPMSIAVACLAMTPMVQDRISNIFETTGNELYINDQSSAGWRLEHWRDLWGHAIQKPLTGHGIRADRYISIAKGDAHNDYLRFFVEAGVIGFITYFAPYIYLLLYSRRKLREETDPLQRRFAGFFLCYIPAFLVMSLTENLASYVIIHWYVWTIAGVFMVLPGLKDELTAVESLQTTENELAVAT